MSCKRLESVAVVYSFDLVFEPARIINAGTAAVDIVVLLHGPRDSPTQLIMFIL